MGASAPILVEEDFTRHKNFIAITIAFEDRFRIDHAVIEKRKM
jgi:hypothetical protein